MTMTDYDQMMLVCLDTGKPLRLCTSEDWTTYLALMDALTPAAKDYGVVDGALFGHAGPVYVHAVGAPPDVRLQVSLSPTAHRRLKAFGNALNLAPGKVIEFLLEQQPLPHELNGVPEHLTRTDTTT